MRLLWGLIWASSFALSLQEPRLLLFSPSVVHLGAPLSVGLQLQDAPRGQEVRGFVFLRNPSHRNAPCSPKVDFLLTSEQDFVLRSLQILPNGADSCGLKSLRGGPKIQLVAQSPWLKSSLSKDVDTQGINLLFSSRRGHLFLQTDQPIYNPGQRVRYRVFALDQKMRPSTDSLTVTVENSQGLLVRKRQVYAPSSIFQDDFVIPDISEPGTWKISARFSDSPDSNHSTQFEVKKYVLPNFEVKIIPGEPYILTAAGVLGDIQLDIQARYIYGKPVQGVAYVRFGLLDENGDKTFLRGLENQTKLAEGQCHISLTKAAVQGALGKLGVQPADLPGLRLYVAAAVIESPGGELEEAELTSWRFVSSPFSLDLRHTKRHLVPGAPFLLQALVRDMSGSPASDIPVKVAAKFSPGSASEIHDQRNTDGRGQVLISINVPQTTSEVQLSVSAGSPYPATAQLTVRAPPAGSSGFLSLERLDSQPPRVGDTFRLNLRAVGVRGASFSHYYYMVLSGGQIVSVGREPRGALTSVSVFVNHRLAPSFYFVAFYYHGGLPVANSLRVDVQAGACEGKLELSVDKHKDYQPGEMLKLQLHTDSAALVALGAVDMALYAAGGKAHKPLDMGKVFEVMSSYDLGCGPGGGDSALQVFEAAGLAFSDGHRLTSTRNSLSCPKEQKTRKKRNVNFQKAISEKLGQYTSPVARRCCQDGLTRLPMTRSCEQRAARVPQPACREPFLSCCQFAEVLRKKTRARGQVGLARALEVLQEEDLMEEDEIPVRSFFPENWLWRVEPVDRYLQLSQLPIPDSLTTWEIHGVSLSKTTGLCVATPVRLRVFREFHLHLRLPISVRRFEQLELRPVLYNYLDTDSPEKLQETAKWLLSQQQADGSFRDPCPVIHRGMQGGLVGNDETVALTAFVVIALHHGLAVFQDRRAEQLKQRVETSISNANSFLGAKASAGLLGAHAAAITAYALTLSKAPEDLRDVAHNNLMAMAQETGDKLYWGSVISSQSNVVSPTPAPRSPADPVPQAPALWIETTAYGLLHLLLREGRAEMADQVAAWLTHQGSFQGGFRSTQDTVIALDALSAYWIASHTAEDRGLNVTISSQGRNGFKSHVLQLSNHQAQGVEEELQFSLGSKINVKVGGNSKGTLKVLRTYNVLDMQNTTCQDLQIEVTVQGHVEYTMAAEEDYKDYYDYENQGDSESLGFAGDDPGALSRPVTPLQLFEGRRSRRRREVPKVAEEQEARVQYTVCIWRNGKVGLSGMAIADITLLSGFHALRADLEKLTSLSDRYVSHFETEGPHVLLYFDSVPTSRECVGFGAVQEVAVGLVQPASATLYDYYNPEHKCSVFYGAPTKSKLLSTLCSADVCQCAEGKCPRQRRALERGQMEEEGYRMKFACYYPRVDYGFQVKVLREDSRAAFRLFETSVVQVLHFSKDAQAAAGQTRNFLVRASCRLRLEPGKEYLIMGLDGTTHDLKGQPQYLLDSNSWIEEMPSERLCRSTRQRAACAQLRAFLQEYGTQGCQV
uniref:C4a anaphylatoxin n=1 Tax=Myotis myotis TaxID=51298 RepID=A0A7J7RK87_MYOMY|nr:hypothetical protein mMyoMyo1_001853 [Myotis myotis]